MWPRCGEGHQREGQGVVGRSVVGRSVELVQREPETRRIGASGWVQLGAGVKDIWFGCQEESLGEGVVVGSLVERPGTKECVGCEQVGSAELCVWVPRCDEKLHMLSDFAQTRVTRPTPLGGPKVPS